MKVFHRVLLSSVFISFGSSLEAFKIQPPEFDVEQAKAMCTKFVEGKDQKEDNYFIRDDHYFTVVMDQELSKLEQATSIQFARTLETPDRRAAYGYEGKDSAGNVVFRFTLHPQAKGIQDPTVEIMSGLLSKEGEGSSITTRDKKIWRVDKISDKKFVFSKILNKSPDVPSDKKGFSKISYKSSDKPWDPSWRSLFASVQLAKGGEETLLSLDSKNFDFGIYRTYGLYTNNGIQFGEIDLFHK